MAQLAYPCKDISVCVEALPLGDIVVTAFNRGFQHLLFTIRSVAQILLVGSHSTLFSSFIPGLSTVATLYP